MGIFESDSDSPPPQKRKKSDRNQKSRSRSRSVRRVGKDNGSAQKSSRAAAPIATPSRRGRSTSPPAAARTPNTDGKKVSSGIGRKKVLVFPSAVASPPPGRTRRLLKQRRKQKNNSSANFVGCIVTSRNGLRDPTHRFPCVRPARNIVTRPKRKA